MAFATGGTAVGDTTTRSSPSSCALRRAAEVGIISAVPSGNTARTSLARIDSLTFSRRLDLRGGKLRPGIMRFVDYSPTYVKSTPQLPQSLLAPLMWGGMEARNAILPAIGNRRCSVQTRRND